MKHDTLTDALSELDDRHITEAMKPRRRYGWLAAVAAVLVLSIGFGLLLRPTIQPEVTLHTPTLPIQTTTPDTRFSTEPQFTVPDLAPTEALSSRYALATACYPTVTLYPSEYNYDTYLAWSADQKALHNQPDGYADSLQSGWSQLIPALLAGDGTSNVACSPMNIYLALAMLAECTDGESRQQILELLNADSIDALRTQANQVWKAHYHNDGLSKSVLGSSLWLEEGYGFDPATVAILAENYYASVFQGDLGSAEMDAALQSWLNEQTGGLLKEQAQNVRFDPMTVLALAATIDYQVQWRDFKFSEKNNTQDIFHGANGDTAETFMHADLSYGPYYWGEHFSAVSLPLEDGSKMWLFLPDHGVSPEEISGEVTAFLADPNKLNQKQIRVNLSLPKFDISSQQDVADTLQQLGVTDVFDSSKADFSPILPAEDGGYVSSVNHAARVMIDEEGVTAAAFTVILRAGTGMPPEEEMDFTLDRPFLFCIESRDGLPLFAGIVNEP